MVLDAFAEQTGATVRFRSAGDDVAAYVGPRIEGGDPPDVAILPQPGVLQTFAKQGDLVEIEDVAGDEVDANFGETAREVGSVDGTLYGVWFKTAQKSTVWYNKAVFEGAGVEPPATLGGAADHRRDDLRLRRGAVFDRRRRRLAAVRPVREHLPAHRRARDCTTSSRRTRSPGPTSP